MYVEHLYCHIVYTEGQLFDWNHDKFTFIILIQFVSLEHSRKHYGNIESSEEN